jgi:uncharacterized protein YbaA (DUF1428 family)
MEAGTMNYVDGYVLAVPKGKKHEYQELATESAAVFKDHGALSVVESWADDVPEGKITSFPLAVQCKDDEAVVFSWIIWPSRNARDEGMKTAMEDERIKAMDPKSMPFDGQRMIFGGFETFLDV